MAELKVAATAPRSFLPMPCPFTEKNESDVMRQIGEGDVRRALLSLLRVARARQSGQPEPDIEYPAGSPEAYYENIRREARSRQRQSGPSLDERMGMQSNRHALAKCSSKWTCETLQKAGLVSDNGDDRDNGIAPANTCIWQRYDTRNKLLQTSARPLGQT